MPRKTTGRPVGRPPGSGQLGEEGTGHKRLTVRLPTELYDALEALAEHEHYTREAPELARTVRTALEHYLACPHRRQTRSVPHASLAHNGQTENSLETLESNTRQTTILQGPLGENRGQTEIAPEPERTTEGPRDKRRQTEKVPTIAEDNNGQTEIQPYDTSKYVLGEICVRGHDYHGTGQSLRQRVGKHECVECMRVRKRAYKERRRQPKRPATSKAGVR